jgi:hypothetical protein
MTKIYLLLILLLSASFASSETFQPPQLSDNMQAMCMKNPYDCKSNKIVTPHLWNTLLYQHYLAVENYFFTLGFDSAEFVYCRSTGCLEEGVHVKNSAYKITRIFPSKKEYFLAFGGVNQNSGVYFIKELTVEASKKYCSLRLRSGNKISKKSARAIENKSVAYLSEIQGKFYKKYSLIFAQYLPSINALDNDGVLPPAECWLRYKTKTFIFETTQD